jgi:mannose-6-phosphate isomerase
VYPLKFIPIYFEKIWGGRGLVSLKNFLPKGNIGEVWEVSCHKNGTSVISNGEYAGLTLKDLIDLDKHKVLGSDFEEGELPLLLKFISANEKLSVQVHPGDDYARKEENEKGKTEAWYVIEATEGANLIIGTENCTSNEFVKGIGEGRLDKYLKKVSVKKGDVFFIESGLIHAIGPGVVLLEIQQSSDVTYRVYDYNRGRELHVKKALDVINLGLTSKSIEGVRTLNEKYEKIEYIYCKYFALEEYNIFESMEDDTRGKEFFIFSCIEGKGKIVYSKGEESIMKGESILIPSSLGGVSILGRLKVIKTYVPSP